MTPGTLVHPPSSRKRSAPEAFGKYLLVERIAVGGMAEVFRALASGPEGFQRTVVIKRVLPTLLENEGFVEMFIDEAKLCALLSHPNLVQIYELGQVDDCFFIAMEHVQGRTLASVEARLIEHGRITPVGAAVEIVRQICLGLHYAHTLRAADGTPLGIVHRDVSPSNVMLSFHGGVKLLDFGIARVSNGLRQSRTQAGTIKGKLSYMSPEQVQRDDIDRRSDIFSTGIVLHELLTGRRLFKASTDFSANRKVMELPIPLPSTLNPAVSPALDRVVMHALERDLGARYASAEDMASDLERVMQDERLPAHEHSKLLNELFPDEPSVTNVRLASLSEPSEESFVPSATADAAPAPAPADMRARSCATVATIADPAAAGGRGERAAMIPSATAQPAAPRGRHRGRERRAKVARAALLAVTLAAGGLGAARAIRQGTRDPLDLDRGNAATLVDQVPGKAARVTAESSTVPLVRCSIDSEPQDATVTQVDDGHLLGRTPFTIEFPRSEKPISLRFERPGAPPVLRKVIPDLDKVVRVELSAANERNAEDDVSGVRGAPWSSRRGRTAASVKALHDAMPVNPFKM
jgi:eukaryotic-like serine/threonine-protein kinase